MHENSCVQNATKSMENYKANAEIMKNYLVVENVGGLGVKTTKKEGKQGAKFA